MLGLKLGRIPDWSSWAPQEPPGGADFGFQREPPLDVLQHRRSHVREALQQRTRNVSATQSVSEKPERVSRDQIPASSFPAARLLTRKAWLALSLSVESSGLSTGVWLVNLESN